MATYDYKCPTCDATTTETFSIHVELPEPICPSCDVKMKRVYSAPAVTFKGTGWGKDGR